MAGDMKRSWAVMAMLADENVAEAVKSSARPRRNALGIIFVLNSARNLARAITAEASRNLRPDRARRRSH